MRLHYQENLIQALHARANGADTRLLALYWTNEPQALLTAENSPVRRVRDLRDRRVGLRRATDGTCRRACAMRGLISALEIHGLYHRHVQWVDLQESEEPSQPDCMPELTALREGRVDAVCVTGADGSEALRAPGVRALFDAGSHPDTWIRIQGAIPYAVTVHAEDEELSWSETECLLESAGIPGRNHILLPAGSSIPLLENMKQFMLRWRFIEADFDIRSWAGEYRTSRGGVAYRSMQAADTGASVTSL